MEKYVFEPEMGEISGFGGSYEEACRKMVVAGLNWLDMHPLAEPKFHGYKGVYGILSEDNAIAKELSTAMVDAAGGDCTGAMHQATVTTVLWIREHSWEEYVKEMKKKD